MAHDTVPQRPDSGPEPILDLDDVMRDALSDLLQTETQYAPVTDAEGRIAGVLSVEIISEFLTLAGGEGRGARRGRAPTGGMSGAGSIASYLAQVEIRDRSEERTASPTTAPSASTGRSTTLTATSPHT